MNVDRIRLQIMELVLTPAGDFPKSFGGHYIQIFQVGLHKPRLIDCVEVEPGTPFKCRFDSDLPIFVRWYASRTVEVVESEELIATGQLTSGALLDVDGRVHGWIHGSGEAIDEPSQLYTKSLIQRARDGHRQLGASADETFVHIDAVLAGWRMKMPLLWFTASAMKITIRSLAAAEELLEYWLQIAERLAVNPADTHTLLCDLVALPSLAWVYRADMSPQGTPNDSWNSIWSSPNPSKAAFDCEDGARACLELFHVIQHLVLSESASHGLRAIQQLARRYTPYLAIVELKAAAGYDRHCMLVLLSPTEPSITVESTAYASGVWRAVKGPVRPVDARVPMDETRRIRIPISVVRQTRMYGRILSLFTSSLKSGTRSEFVVCRDASEFGVDAEKFLTSTNREPFMQRVLVDVDNTKFDPYLRLTPRSMLPLAPTIHSALPEFSNGRAVPLVARQKGIQLTRDGLVIGIATVCIKNEQSQFQTKRTPAPHIRA